MNSTETSKLYRRLCSLESKASSLRAFGKHPEYYRRLEVLLHELETEFGGIWVTSLPRVSKSGRITVTVWTSLPRDLALVRRAVYNKRSEKWRVIQ